MEADGWVDEVLSFWFREVGPEQWFDGAPELDQAIRARFAVLHERLAAALPREVWRNPRAALAAVIALDQFPRNMFRGTPRAFASDLEAAAVARNAIDGELDRDMTPEEKKFLFMPLMHSEALPDQERCVTLFKALGDEEALKYAEEHRDIIERFGRFPHRNRALGRATTPDESRFLSGHAGYGQ